MDLKLSFPPTISKNFDINYKIYDKVLLVNNIWSYMQILFHLRSKSIQTQFKWSLFKTCDDGVVSLLEGITLSNDVVF